MRLLFLRCVNTNLSVAMFISHIHPKTQILIMQDGSYTSDFLSQLHVKQRLSTKRPITSCVPFYRTHPDLSAATRYIHNRAAFVVDSFPLTLVFMLSGTQFVATIGTKSFQHGSFKTAKDHRNLETLNIKPHPSRMSQTSGTNCNHYNT